MTRALPLLIALTGLAVAQQSKFEAFEVATIKPAGPQQPTAGRYVRMQSAHNFQAHNYTVNGLIAAAWSLNPRAISGGPGWVQSDAWEILAKTPGEARPTFDEQMTMVRRLLADRFNLSFHREKKEFAIYSISVLKSSPNLKVSPAPPDEAPNMTSTVYPASSGGIDYVHLPAHNVTMTQFAALLSRAILDRPVVDNTGLTDRYDFDLVWTPDETQFGGNLPPGPPDSARPGLFLAMQQQLGLKIEATRGPVEALVIDRVEKPSDN